MGIDLELADCAAARYRQDECREAALVCPHDPDCQRNLDDLLERAAADRPQAGACPSEFAYRRFSDINQNMRLTGMGYEAEVQTWEAPSTGPDDEQSPQQQEAAYLRWRSQTAPGKSGIPAFKLRSNDRWLVTTKEIDEALAAYAGVPSEQRARLETEPKWADWLAWLTVAREHGGFEAE